MPQPERGEAGAPRPAIAYLFLLLPTMFWGSNIVIARALVQDMPAPGLILARWTAALVILLPLAGASLWRERRIAWANRWTLVLLGVSGIAGFNSLVYVALDHTTAVNGSLIQGGIPITVVCLSWLIGGEKVGPRVIAAMAVSFVGLAVIVLHGELEGLFRLRFNPGDALMAGAIWIWGFYIVMANRHPTGLTPPAFLLAIVLLGEATLVLVAATGIAGSLDFAVTPERAISTSVRPGRCRPAATLRAVPPSTGSGRQARFTWRCLTAAASLSMSCCRMAMPTGAGRPC